jgi:hypothetical protein
MSSMNNRGRRTDEPWRVPFGKHEGKLLADVPRTYLRWMAEKCDDIDEGLRLAVVCILGGEKGAGGATVDAVFEKVERRYRKNDAALAALAETRAGLRRAGYA